MKTFVSLALLAACSLALAATPQQIQQTYSAEAGRLFPGFSPSAARGAAFFKQQFAVAEKMPACSSCHTDNPAAPGRHAVTGKDIRPLAPHANAERLSDPAKVEKWFGRNCKEVVGRVCTPAEKADFMQFLVEVR